MTDNNVIDVFHDPSSNKYWMIDEKLKVIAEVRRALPNEPGEWVQIGKWLSFEREGIVNRVSLEN